MDFPKGSFWRFLKGKGSRIPGPKRGLVRGTGYLPKTFFRTGKRSPEGVKLPPGVFTLNPG